MHALQQPPQGVKMSYMGVGRAATIILDLKQANFKLTEGESETVTKLPTFKWHRTSISNEKVVIRVLRKNLHVALNAILKILNSHTGEDYQVESFRVMGMG